MKLVGNDDDDNEADKLVPIIWGRLLSQLWLELEAWPSCSLESTGTGGGWQGGKKCFTSWEPRFLGQYFARDSVIHGPAVADKN